MSATISASKLRPRSTPVPSAIARPSITRRCSVCCSRHLRSSGLATTAEKSNASAPRQRKSTVPATRRASASASLSANATRIPRSATAVKANASAPRQRGSILPTMRRAGMLPAISSPANATRIPRSAAAVKANTSAPRQRESALPATAAKPVIAATSTVVPVAVVEMLKQQQAKFELLLEGLSANFLSAVQANASKTAALEERFASIEQQMDDIKTHSSRDDALELVRARSNSDQLKTALNIAHTQLEHIMPRLCEDVQRLKDQQAASNAQIGAALAGTERMLQAKSAKNASTIHSLHSKITNTEQRHAREQKKITHVLRSVVEDLSTHATSIVELQLHGRFRARPQQRFHAAQALMETGLFDDDDEEGKDVAVDHSKSATSASDTETSPSEDDSTPASSPTSSRSCARGF